MWSLALSLPSAFLGSVLIGFSSNVYLALLQGMLGSLPGRRSSADTNTHTKGSSSSSSSASGMTFGLSTTMDRGARALAPMIAAASLNANLSVPSGLFHIIGSLGPGATSGLSAAEAEAITIVHANQTLGLALACLLSCLYTIGLLIYHQCRQGGKEGKKKKKQTSGGYLRYPSSP